EDVVIPLPRMGDYCDGIERLNIELSIRNKLDLCDTLAAFLQAPVNEWPLHMGDANLAKEELVGDRREQALAAIAEVRSRWQGLFDNLDGAWPPPEVAPQPRHWHPLPAPPRPVPVRRWHPVPATVFGKLQDYSVRVSWKTELKPLLDDIFDGTAFHPVLERIAAIHQEVLKGRVFVALHMHAGDGNVHTNIPVNSDNYAMLQTAYRTVERIMALARSLGGVISGEHGIGITKLEFLSDAEIAPFRDYKHRIDPAGVFNKGKLMAGADLRNAYTPSFALLGIESLIMEQSEIGNIAAAVKDCLRCGKCKPVCSTHVPRANLLYSPRNKILGVGLLVEAFLYEEQTRRGISLKHFDEFSDVADHCTVCHRCVKPCPVDIDFGDVSIAMRNFLRKSGKKKSAPQTKLAMAFLSATDPTTIKAMKAGMIDLGYRAQRLGHALAKTLGLTQDTVRRPPASLGRPEIRTQVIHFLNKPMPANVPARTARALLDIEDAATIPVIRNPRSGDTFPEGDAVFYFPGCGSERLFSQVGLATQAMLWHVGATTVLPPGYLCCGYPQTSAGDEDKGQAITTQNRVLFHRVANTLNYLDIKTVIVSCGTCLDQLETYQFDRIFPGCRLIDIHEYLMEKGVKLDGVPGVQFMYHEPCHTPMKIHNGTQVASRLLGQRVDLNDRCCGESGTLAVTRPDVSTQVRFRKQQEIEQGIEKLGAGGTARTKILTSCPSCLQGLSRYREDAPIEADYIVIELARNILGENWLRQYVDAANAGGIERVLL
ncbi:MAG: FAD-binding and (Fe-S)-binding domain-containing protein, partial [Rhodocyclaceae bacterium]|nr:FAD-binding and (Fe-S)-binding domain-containing protein [Rhodocyclaceae bacterium]